MDEHVFEARLALRRCVISGSPAERRQRASSAARSRPLTCSAAPKKAACSTPGRAFAALQDQLAHAVALDHECDEARLRDDLGHRAARDRCGRQDIDDAVAAFGLVHVMGADENGEALVATADGSLPRNRAAPADRRPPSVRPAASSFGCVQHAGGKRQPLLPAARQFARQLVLAPGQAKPIASVPSTICFAVGELDRCRATNSRFSRIDRSSQKEKRWVM